MQAIGDGVNRLTMMVSNLLTMVEHHDGAGRPTLQPVAATDFLQEFLRGRETFSGIGTLKTEVEESAEGAFVLLNRNRFPLVLTNLLDNSFKFAREGTAPEVLLRLRREGDEVLLKLESGGGMVHGYGLASSQLDRIKAAGLPLTISVDKVAASGGYMMACIADKIVSAPFAIVGSIGVIAQLPNFNKLLKKHDIEFEQLTAGEYKRTLTMFGENTDKARDKFKQELEETHVLFKDFISERRPALELEKVATGEHWFGKQAKELGLVDEISTSDDLVVAACKEKTVLAVHYVQKKKLADKLAGVASKVADSVVLKLAERGQKPIV